MKHKELLPEQVFHVYQRTSDGGLLFYTVSDYLVFYSICSVAVRRSGVVMLGLCQMPDHIHLVVHSKSKKQLSGFVSLYTAAFAREFNKTGGLKGTLFEHGFGRAIKIGPKKIRTALAYLYNNPVERKLSIRAEEYRWNYLAYAASSHPFSIKYALAHVSRPFRRALKLVEDLFGSGSFLRHATADLLFDSINDIEKQQLTDKIISLWSVIDYELLISYYGSYDSVITAFASNTGSEYDIAETFEAQSDQVYNKMSTLLVREGWVKRPREVISMEQEKRIDILLRLQKAFNATPRQLEKYLHLQLHQV